MFIGILPGNVFMNMIAQQERRAAKRVKLDWPVCLWHDNTQQFYNGRSSDISATGALIKLPLTAPISKNDSVEVNFPAPDDSEQESKVFTAKVVRVNRGQSILDGNQFVALQFVDG